MNNIKNTIFIFIKKMGCGSTKGISIIENTKKEEKKVVDKNENNKNGVDKGTEFICIYKNNDNEIFNNFEINEEEISMYVDREKMKTIYDECKSNLESIKSKVSYEINQNKITFKVKEFIPNFKFIYFNTKNLETIQLVKFDLSNFKNISLLFGFCDYIEYLDLSNFDTKNVTNMEELFYGCHNLKEIKGFNNCENVENMKRIFWACDNLDNLDLSNLNTKNVINMERMFYCCFKLNQIIGLNNFNTEKVKNMEGMFQNNSLKYLDVSSFNTENVTNMSEMFYGCFNLKEIRGLNNFNTEKVENMKGMFFGCDLIKYLDLSSFNTKNVTNMSQMFEECEKLKEINGLSNFNTEKVESMWGMFRECSSLEFLDLTNFNTKNLTNIEFMFRECENLREIRGLENFKHIEGQDMFGEPVDYGW